MWLKIQICSPSVGSIGSATLFGLYRALVCPHRKPRRDVPVASRLAENNGRAFMVQDGDGRQSSNADVDFEEYGESFQFPSTKFPSPKFP